MTLILDTGPILALLDAGDPDHARCVSMVTSLDEDLVVPSATLVEVEYWCRKLLRPSVFGDFADDVVNGAYRLVNLDPRGIRRAAALTAQYHSLKLGFVDACVITTCEQLRETKVATLDRRHFAVVRPQHCAALTLLP